MLPGCLRQQGAIAKGNAPPPGGRTMRTIRWVPWTCLLLGLLLVGPGPAAADGLEEEIEARLERIEILVDEARALERQGRTAVAEALHARVEMLEAEVRELRREQAHAEAEEIEEAVEEAARDGASMLLRLLEAALADEDEGAEELLEGLHRLAEHLAEETKRDDESSRDDDSSSDDESRERLHAKRRAHLEHATELLHAARKAFREVGEAEVVELMERAIRVHELMLEGAVEQAHRLVRRYELEEDEIRSLLRRAAGLYRQWGHPGIAERLLELAGRAHEKVETEPLTHEQALERIEALQERVEVVLKLAGSIQDDLEALAKEIRRAR